MALKHKEILEQFDDDWRGDQSNRDEALDDLRSLSGLGQWDGEELRQRQNEGRPALTVNLQPQFVRQVANDIKQMRPSVKTVPVDDKTDPVLSEIFDGLIRQIEYQSNAAHAYGHGGAMAVACGIGHWRVETDFVRDAVFDQEIKIKRILDPLSVVWDASAVDVTRADAEHCHVTSMVPKNKFKSKFPKAGREGADYPQDAYGANSGLYTYWQNGDNIRIAEYWYQVPVTRKLALLPSGETIDVTGLSHNTVSVLNDIGIVGEREFIDYSIKRVLLDGNDFLGDPENWAGRFIPIIPCLGDEVSFDHRVVRTGLIRWTKDSQKAYNYWRSASMETIANAPKAPWLLTPEMVEGYEDLWARANHSNLAYLVYNSNPDSPNIRPQRERPPDVPVALYQEANIARDEMKGVTGIYDASLGAAGNETSGRAIMARERQGDVGSYHFMDNFNAAIHRTGQVLIDLIPKIYDTDRVVRIVGKDDSEQFVPINRTVVTDNNEQVIINDLSTARFDLRVKTGPSYTTQRVEAREQIMQALQAAPQLWGVIGDLVFKYSDFEGADEIAERLKPQQPLDSNAPQPPNPMQEIAMKLGAAKEEVAIMLDRAKVEKTLAETDKTQAETSNIMREALITPDTQ